MKKLFLLIIILFPNIAFSDPMNVIDDWELLEQSYSTELFSSDNNYKLHLANNEELNIRNNNTNEDAAKTFRPRNEHQFIGTGLPLPRP